MRATRGRLRMASFDVPERRFNPIGSSGLFLDAIAEEPLGIDWVETQPMLEFLAQFADVALDDVLVNILVEEPVDRVEDLRLADAPTATAQQKLQNPPLPARERKGLAVHFWLAPVKINVQFADRHVALPAKHAPVDRADPGYDLTHVHRLPQNVVGASGE